MSTTTANDNVGKSTRVDEDRRVGARRRSLSLADAAAEFWRHPSPWLIGTSLVVAGTARALTAGWSWVDATLPLTLLAVWPLVEWIVHVTVLHFRPKQIGPVTMDLYVAKKHREHHANPRQVDLIFIPTRVLVSLLATYVLAVFFVFPRVSLGLTFLTVISAIGMVYEWTHYLVHTDYRPKTALYRAVWRHHRLHHYKNENYWMTVTTANTADRLLRTNPDPSDVETSPTAQALHADVA